MTGLEYIILGGVLMAAGVLLLYAWINNKSRWFDASFDQQNSRKMGCLFWVFYLLYFLALVIAPLLGGALLIVWGLQD